MAHIYIGDRSRVDDEVLEAIKKLPDDFWVFAEFGIGRNVDWLVIRPFPDGPATMIMAELKRISRRLTGDENGPWKEEVSSGEWRELESNNRDDINPYWQAVNIANEVKQWLWNNQPRYRLDGEPVTQDDCGVWPDLLLLGPTGLRHLLPIKPLSNFGRWFYTTDEWIAHLLTWRPKRGMLLNEAELRQIALALRLTPLDSGESGEEASSQTVLERLAAVERRLFELERNQLRVPQSNGTAAIDDELQNALREAVLLVRKTGRSRATPSVLEALKTTLGYDVKQANYHGFGTASVLFERARKDGIIKFGPALGPNPTIFLPEEEM